MGKISIRILILACACSVLMLEPTAYGYWVWTPKSGKWINPKYAVKDTPTQQMEWGMGFFDSGDYKRAISEFEKLIAGYPNSAQSPEAQYYIGRSYEGLEDYYQAFVAYQKAVDKYPYNDRFDETIERQYKIGSIFLEGQKAKIMGMKILPAMDKASEVLAKVVQNAPYGRYADVAQFKLGEAYKKQEFFEEALMAYQKLIDDYPKSAFLDEAKYNVALCTYYVSRDPSYDQEFTDKAIKGYEELIKMTDDIALNKEAGQTLKRLREKKAKSTFETAQFYEKTKHYQSAIIYYKDVVENYADTPIAAQAIEKITELEHKVGYGG